MACSAVAFAGTIQTFAVFSPEMKENFDLSQSQGRASGLHFFKASVVSKRTNREDRERERGKEINKRK